MRIIYLARVSGVMEIPHAEHNSRNSVGWLTCSKVKCYTTLIRRETWVPHGRGDPSGAKSGKPINVVHMSSTFAPSLTTAIIFRCLGSHDCFRTKRSLFANGPKKKLVEVQGCQFSQKKCKEGI